MRGELNLVVWYSGECRRRFKVAPLYPMCSNKPVWIHRDICMCGISKLFRRISWCNLFSDIAEVSVNQAESRYQETKTRFPNEKIFSGEFITADCTKVRLIHLFISLLECYAFMSFELI